jgi:transcriptional regulator with XRE-family HTH domain
VILGRGVEMETRLKEARTARGWSQLRLIIELERRATALKLTLPSRASLKTEVSRWENGHVSPDDLSFWGRLPPPRQGDV